MAATLPAISPSGRKSQSPMMTHHSLPTPPESPMNPASRLQFVGQAKRKLHKNKEKELEERRFYLRKEQPDLSKIQTTEYRNTYKHNLCIDILQEGYHKSFAELFALMRQQSEERLQAGPESVLWTKTLLEEEPEKLEVLKKYLTQAETASRVDDLAEVYKCQITLARHFQQTGDHWLADHFFHACLRTGASAKHDKGKMAAQGHCCVGLCQEENGDKFDAAENFELFHKLSTANPSWKLDDGESMHLMACKHLTRIYTKIANDFMNVGDLQQYLSYLQKAYNMAKEGSDQELLGIASYRLGQAYEKNGDSKTAIEYLNGYLEICRSTGDKAGYGRGCEAMAKSYESLGKVEEAIKYLEMFVASAEEIKDDRAISQACSGLGAMFNSLGKYDQAVEYFNKSYNISRAMNDTETISSSRVLFGVAAAHKMLHNVTEHINVGTRPCLERLIEWKDNRGDEFEKPIPAPKSDED